MAHRLGRLGDAIVRAKTSLHRLTSGYHGAIRKSMFRDHETRTFRTAWPRCGGNRRPHRPDCRSRAVGFRASRIPTRSGQCPKSWNAAPVSTPLSPSAVKRYPEATSTGVSRQNRRSGDDSRISACRGSRPSGGAFGSRHGGCDAGAGRYLPVHGRPRAPSPERSRDSAHGLRSSPSAFALVCLGDRVGPVLLVATAVLVLAVAFLVPAAFGGHAT